MYLEETNLFTCGCDSLNCPYKEGMKSENILNTDFNSNRDGNPKSIPKMTTANSTNGTNTEPDVRNEAVLALRNKFPNKIPIILKRFSREANLPHLDKSKYLVPQEITMSQFQTIIRNRMRMGPNQALYLLINDRSMLSLSLTLAEVYSNYADPDGFLYITYASQEVFGAELTS